MLYQLFFLRRDVAPEQVRIGIIPIKNPDGSPRTVEAASPDEAFRLAASVTGDYFSHSLAIGRLDYGPNPRLF